MSDILEIREFLNLGGPLYDVRSPAEYSQGAIPAAINLPLFSNEERASVGTTYKKIGRQEAFCEGLGLVGPKMRAFVETGLANKVLGLPRVYCWRGGMRSQAMAWLFAMAGLKPVTLRGGYKTFRCFALSQFVKPYRFQVIGGFTGSGKTQLLHDLKNEGKQILDLEALAGHRGSAFGLLGMPKQPTTEQFENSLAFALSQMDIEKPIYTEDESRMIGTCKIPDALFATLRASPLYFLETAKEERLNRLLYEYGKYPEKDLILAAERLMKRLGGVRTQEVITAIQQQNLPHALEILLNYYDAAYLYSLAKSGRKRITYER